MIDRKSVPFHSGPSNVLIDEPEKCPICKFAIKPETLSVSGFVDGKDLHYAAVTYLCKHCFQPFIGFYKRRDKVPSGGNVYNSVCIYIEPVRFLRQEFDAEILKLSPDFDEIYNQALAAESAGLNQISGIGYRKAFEFLIKDFLISRMPEDAETIKEMSLGNCINNRVTNERLKISASRCAWLGNDQTHYIQKFTEYDIEDLKRLIKASVHWITMELLTDEAERIEPRNH